jgi:glc operon protein GlcG
MDHFSSGTPRACTARGAIIALLVLYAGWRGAETAAQDTSRAAIKEGDTKLGSDVKDTAGLFEFDAITAARKELARIERETNVATVIQTVDSLRGQSIGEAAARAARQSDIHGIFVMIAKNEKEIEILVSKKYLEALTRPRRDAIRAGFIEGFRRRDYNDGLKHGVAAIAEQVAAAQRSGGLPQTTAAALIGFTFAKPASSDDNSPLVVRNQVRLGLAGARAIIAGALAKAQAMQLKVNIAVVDDGGHLLAFERMDGARPASGYTAITKATTAATFRQATGPLAAGTTPADPLLNLSLQNAAQASGGKITTLYGGVPVVVDGQCIGGVGIGGGTGEQDAQVARAGVQSLVDQLAKAVHVEKEMKTDEKTK